jgi:mono/diheme cytochrome c family protein
MIQMSLHSKMSPHIRKYLAAALLGLVLPALAAVAAHHLHKAVAADPGGSEDEAVARGRYMITVSGCNDCHTAGYMPGGGAVPEEKWLTGDSLGFRGGWGTTYPTNLRLYMQDLSEDDWVELARSMETRPPMPWFNVRKMSEEDLRAIHRYIRHLGPAGQPAPDALPPGEEPKTPWFNFEPVMPRK